MGIDQVNIHPHVRPYSNRVTRIQDLILKLTYLNRVKMIVVQPGEEGW